MIESLAAVIIYTGTNVCSALDKSPTTDTVLDVIFDMADGNLSEANGERIGKKIANQVVSQCPEHLPVLERFVEIYG